MFSVNHFIWLLICFVLVIGAFLVVKRKGFTMTQVLNGCCTLAVLSEIIKVFSTVRLVPSADGTMLSPYLELNHLPLHLCSIQVLLFFIVRFTKNEKMRTVILAFMYPSCILGALFALVLPSIFSTTITVAQAFTHPMAYQFFIYHAMLVFFSLYIIGSGEVELKPKHYFITIAMLAVGAFTSIYVNSMVAVPVYEAGKLVSVEFATNFFFTMKPPIPINLTEKWHWLLYYLIITMLAVVLVAGMYIPVFNKAKKQSRHTK